MVGLCGNVGYYVCFGYMIEFVVEVDFGFGLELVYQVYEFFGVGIVVGGIGLGIVIFGGVVLI